jgi:cysteine desulfuration protein SufE
MGVLVRGLVRTVVLEQQPVVLPRLEFILAWTASRTGMCPRRDVAGVQNGWRRLPWGEGGTDVHSHGWLPAEPTTSLFFAGSAGRPPMMTDMPFPPSIEEILEEFEDMEDWEERYEYLIELGRELPKLDDSCMCEDNLVHGCMSTVWLVVEPTDTGALHVRADSDSLIVKGLIVVLLAAFDQKAPQAMLDVDAESLFDRLGLSQHLSANRRNGLFSMVQRVRKLAVEHAA